MRFAKEGIEINSGNASLYATLPTDPSQKLLVFERGTIRIGPTVDMFLVPTDRNRIGFLYGRHSPDNFRAKHFISIGEPDEPSDSDIIAGAADICQKQKYGSFLWKEQYNPETTQTKKHFADSLTPQEAIDRYQDGLNILRKNYSLEQFLGDWFSNHVTARITNLAIQNYSPLEVKLHFTRGEIPEEVLIFGLHSALKQIGWDFVSPRVSHGSMEIWPLTTTSP